MSREARPGVSSNRYKDPRLGDPLTRRQVQMLDMVHAGLENKEIAARSGISVKTVEALLALARVKAGRHNRVLLSLWWHDNREAELRKITVAWARQFEAAV